MIQTYVNNFISLLISKMSQFQSDASGSNIGYGYAGFDSAYEYSRINNLGLFSSVFFIGGSPMPGKRSYGALNWEWNYLMRVYVVADLGGSRLVDKTITTLIENFFSVIVEPANVQSVVTEGTIKMLGLSSGVQPYKVNDVDYLSVEILFGITEQIT